MKKVLFLFSLLCSVGMNAQVVDSSFYGNIKAGMLKAEYDANISETRIRIMNDEYELIPRFHRDQELTELNMESAPESLENYNVIEKKMLSLYDVISTKYGRAQSLSLINDPTSIPDGATRNITSWDIGLKHINIGARREGNDYKVVCNIVIKGYDEKLTDRDLAREQAARRQAGARF